MKYGDGNHYAIENFKSVREWLNDPEKFWERSTVFGSNLDAMRQIYGEPQGKFQGSEYLFDVWEQTFENLTIHLLAANGKGCCIEVNLPSKVDPWNGNTKEIEDSLVKFMDEHLKRLEDVLGKKQLPAGVKKKKGVFG